MKTFATILTNNIYINALVCIYKYLYGLLRNTYFWEGELKS